MRKRNKLLLISTMLLLAGCAERPSLKETPSNTESPSNETPTSTEPKTEENKKPQIKINEIESDDPNGGVDWVEIINIGDAAADISGYFVVDNKGLERYSGQKTTPIAQGKTLQKGEILVLNGDSDFSFGLGKSDTVTLYNDEKEVIDSYSYEGHALGTYSRLPDGMGEFIDQAPSKGILNKDAKKEDTPSEPTTSSDVKINEINSAPDDWVELFNNGNRDIDISGYELRDNSDDHRYKIANGTTIAPKSFLVVEANTIGLVYDDQSKTFVNGKFDEAIGLGSNDSVRLYNEKGELIDSYRYEKHASKDGDDSLASYGRYPNGTGNFVLAKETKGLANEWYKPSIKINEIESKDPNGGPDWVEIFNAGDTDIDISGYYLLDNDPVTHLKETTPIATGTILKAGEFFVFEEKVNFSFGLGKADKATIYSNGGIEIDSYEWSNQVNGVYARIPDGIGALIDFDTPTKGKANIKTSPAVLNEIQSKDPSNAHDWIELANPTNEQIDVSGLLIKDSGEENPYTIKEGTFIEANSFLLINDFAFGLGKDDSVRLFENNRLIDSVTYTGHTSPSYGRYPDANGKEWRSTKKQTPGEANLFEGIPLKISWPGDNNIETYDKTPVFLEDSSGLDFHENKLYAVDNGVGKFWALDVNKDGSMELAKGYEEGKQVRFQKDKDNPSAKGPDTEGITLDKEGNVYLASERDNSNKGVNFNSILMVSKDNIDESNIIVANKEWDVTSLLPSVSANMGIEAIEWVSKENLEGKLFDQSKNAAFSFTNYPNAIADGLFFLALEDNGHVYALALNNDGSSTLIADIDTKLGGAMALDYDDYEKKLWVTTDNGYNNLAATISFNSLENPDITHVLPPTGLDINANNEGFAIADATYLENGKRPVYRFQDGVKEGALTIGSLTSQL